MSERTQETVDAPAPEADVLAPAGEVQRAMAEVLAAPPGVQAPSVGALIEALLRVTRGPDADADGRAVLQVLDEASVREARDIDGRSVRYEAVNALLRLGYPWALKVDPEDLQFFRQGSGQTKGSRRWVAVLLGALLAAGGGYATWMLVFSAVAAPLSLTVPQGRVEVKVAPAREFYGALPKELVVQVEAFVPPETLTRTGVEAVEMVDAWTGEVLQQWAGAQIQDQGVSGDERVQLHKVWVTFPSALPLADEVIFAVRVSIPGAGPAVVRTQRMSLAKLGEPSKLHL